MVQMIINSFNIMSYLHNSLCYKFRLWQGKRKKKCKGQGGEIYQNGSLKCNLVMFWNQRSSRNWQTKSRWSIWNVPDGWFKMILTEIFTALVRAHTSIVSKKVKRFLFGRRLVRYFNNNWQNEGGPWKRVRQYSKNIWHVEGEGLKNWGWWWQIYIQAFWKSGIWN